MMKALLGLSLGLNLMLGYLFLTRKPEKEVVERLVIETHAEPGIIKPEVQKEILPPRPSEKVNKKKDGPEFETLDSQELQDAGEKMENDRLDFMTNTLGMSEEKIVRHNKIRDDFYKKTAQFWQKNPMRELSFEERRQMLLLEEDLYKKLEKLHGKKNWTKYQKYRETYNQKGFKRQTEDNQPFIFMGL